ncbi:MAG: DUF2723 domain-containing protein [Bacteroidales bacterium]|nr:DUF2723 domain-containing protein [Bacteroidales bacterium]
MIEKKFKLWNRIAAAFAFVVSAFTYLSTIEPTASFWDCGEFIASSYKLEVGHPPGNPTFQVLARIFTLFGDNMHAAVLVNAMSALCSALTILFLYLTIVWFAKRMTKRLSVAVIGSGLVGALAYCFSDTFWFSAVEGEVYAMSSLVTALVFWIMTLWYDRADEPHANRWIVLIAFIMGLSIGIHLLNLLMIPALVFMFYYRRREDGPFTVKELFKILLIGGAILGIMVFMVIPWLPKMAAYVDLFFVNVLGLPYNSGAAFFLVTVLGLCFWGLFRTLDKGKVFWNTALLCLTTIIVGFSIFSVDIIRSCAKTPTNEYQPDNAFTLVRYLTREQYGSTPLVYGQYYDAPFQVKENKYWAPMDGKYKKVDGPGEAKYDASGKMLFPRMWSSVDPQSKDIYKIYTRGKGKKIKGASSPKPSMGANLAYFFDFQLGWMYWRYFMWNFAGRQNDVHSPSPGNIFHGNWESGIKVLDDWRLGDQSDAPSVLADNKGKNHYYLLPFLLGLIGLFFQFGKDKRGCWLNFLMFFMTGIAVVIYLNMPPFQVRERDYAFAGSFYFFTVWIGLGVLGLYDLLDETLNRKFSTSLGAFLTAVCLCVPALMAAENWDDHDRSGRRTAPELGANYLKSVGPQGVLVTHGDNDTFPLWYAQEVENVRTDVRIANTSLLGTDWHIDQMKWACNESKPLPLTVGPEQYLYGTNEYIPIYDQRGRVMSIADVMTLFKHPQVKVQMSSGRRYDYIASRKISVPVNKENALASGIVPPAMAGRIADTIVLEIPANKDFLTKPELFVLDFLSNYQWDRPFNVLSNGGDINIGIKDYLMSDGFSAKLVPFKNRPSSSSFGLVDPDELWHYMTEVYSFDALKAPGWFVDYQNCYTFLAVMGIRSLHVNCASSFLGCGQPERALAMLDQSEAAMVNFPVCSIPIGFSGNDYMVVKTVDLYYKLGHGEKGRELAVKYADEVLAAAAFYLQFYAFAEDEFELCGNYIYYLSDVLEQGGEKELGKQIEKRFSDLVESATAK